MAAGTYAWMIPLRRSAWQCGHCHRMSVASTPAAKLVLVAFFVSASASSLQGELDLSSLLYNNLGGVGPDTGVEQSMRFSNVATAADGTQVDMSVTPTSSYAPPDPSENGLVETTDPSQVARLASINMKAGAQVSLLVKFFKAGSTVSAMSVPEFWFTVFDTESHPNQQEERFWVTGFEAVYLTDDTWLAFQDASAAGVCFKSTSVRNVVNPSNPMLLSAEQRAHTATFLFKDTESFEWRIYFSPGSSNQDRNNWNVFFGSAANAAGYSQSVPMSFISGKTSWQSSSDWLPSLSNDTASLDDTDTGAGGGGSSPGFQVPNPTTCSCNLDLTNVQVNNLGGRGPGTSGGASLRYGNVCTVDGKSIDLVIEAVGDYSSPDVHTNGRSSCGAYGSISVQFGTVVVLEARFIDPETSLPVLIKDFFLTVFDMDLHGTHQEKVSIRGFEAHFLTPGSLVTTEEILGGTVFSSPSVIDDVTCPADPMNLNTQEANIAATVLFKDVEQFGFSLEVLGTRENKTHTFLVGGTSSLNADCAGHGLPTSTTTTATVTTTTLTETNTTVTTETTTQTATTILTVTVSNTTVTTVTTNTSSHTATLASTSTGTNTTATSTTTFTNPTTGTNTTGTNTTTRTTTITQLTTNTTVLTTTVTTTFDCLAGAMENFTLDQSAWCCKHAQRGCITVTNTTTRSATVPSTTATVTATVSNTTTSPPFTCSRTADFAEWAEQQRVWCCQHFSVGCPGANPYNCVSGYALWKVKWSMQKKIWCCQHDNRGCLPSTSTTTSAPFNCQAASPNSWPANHRTWCCKNRHVGCTTGTTSARNPSSDPYDCNAGLMNWKFGWSAKKEAWCCREKKVGCRDGTTTSLPVAEPWNPFDCNEDFATWHSTWSHPKRQWCCRNFQKACEGTTQEPYDCTAGYTNWQTGWSQKKREWCCKSYNRGCTNIVKEYELEPMHTLGRSWQPVTTLLAAGTAALSASLLLAVVVCLSRRCLDSPGNHARFAPAYGPLTITASVSRRGAPTELLL